jgi:hypothetical protein
MVDNIMAATITLSFDGIPDRVITASNSKLQEIAPIYGVDTEDYDTTEEALTELQSVVADLIKQPWTRQKNRERPPVDVGDDFE